jgi:hypothetical protein
MTRAQAAQAGGLPYTPVDSAGVCTWMKVDVSGTTHLVMVENDRVVRLDVKAADIAAPGGGRAGQRESDILQTYGSKVTARPHKYVEGKYLIIRSNSDSLRRLVFETNGDSVTRWRIGIYPPVEYVEGCS